MPVHYIGFWLVLHHSITPEFLPLYLTFKHLKCPEITGGARSGLQGRCSTGVCQCLLMLTSPF